MITKQISGKNYGVQKMIGVHKQYTEGSLRSKHRNTGTNQARINADQGRHPFT